jgi:hypothetical protein
MKNQHCQRLEHIAFLDDYVCHLSAVLGPPQVKSSNGQILTGWAFEFPFGERHWALTHVSDEPVANGVHCLQCEPVCWSVLGQTRDTATLRHLARYLMDGDDFYQDEQLVAGSDG